MKYIQSAPIHFTDPDAGRSSSGHKFHNWITGLYLSKLFDLEYVYSPFTEDAERYEAFLNLHTAYRSTDQISNTSVVELGTPELCHNDELDHIHYYQSIERIREVIESSSDETLFKLGHNPFPGLLTQYYSKVVEELQQAYWSLDRGIDLKYESSKVSIAIHIRRGDINASKNPDRWLDLDYYAGIIDKFNSELGLELLDIHIFSEGQPEDFKVLVRENITLQLGGSDLEAFHHMCAADILITGQSSFSIMASYFNRGTIICTPLKNLMYKWEDAQRMHIDRIDFNSLRRSFNVR